MCRALSLISETSTTIYTADLCCFSTVLYIIATFFSLSTAAVVSPSFSVGGTRFEFPENDGVAAACFQATNVDESFTVGYRTEDLNPPDATGIYGQSYYNYISNISLCTIILLPDSISY